MATKAKMAQLNKKPKFAVRHRNRCRRCGRPRGYLRKFDLCRVCFRELGLQGLVPGVRKASW
jgi:small subunit ribosomal protein S14